LKLLSKRSKKGEENKIKKEEEKKVEIENNKKQAVAKKKKGDLFNLLFGGFLFISSSIGLFMLYRFRNKFVKK
jgi:hypothetical protein